MTESAMLVVYGASARGDASLREAVRSTRRRGGRLAVVALALQESPHPCCCNLQAGYWNGVMRDMARRELTKARLVVEDDPSVALDVIGFRGFRAPDAIASYAEELAAERIVLADPRAAGLGRRALRRLRRRSAVPVSEGAARLTNS